MADTILPETTQIIKLTPIPTVITMEKRHSKERVTQSRMEHATTETGWGKP